MIWYRNSLLMGYFSFGFSDIDVSVELASNYEIQSKAKGIQRFLTLCPLIKEINFYYPFCISVLPVLVNFFELQRDPKLFQKIKPVRDMPEFLEAQKVAYFLRVFFSNLNNLKNGLTKRDIEKWMYHFDLVECPVCESDLMKIQTEKDLLRLILSKFEKLEENYFFAMDSLAQSQIHQNPLHVYYQDSDYPKELFSLVPHMFSFTGGTLKGAPSFLEKVFVSQMSWEVFGMITQPQQFGKNTYGRQHLHDLISTLENADLGDRSCMERRNRLVEIIKQYQKLMNLESI